MIARLRKRIEAGRARLQGWADEAERLERDDAAARAGLLAAVQILDVSPDGYVTYALVGERRIFATVRARTPQEAGAELARVVRAHSIRVQGL